MKIALSGYGRMGKEIERIALDRGHEIIVTFNDPDDWVGKEDLLAKADVAIEFSMPHSVVSNIFKCFDEGVPVVVGTTGWSGQLDHVREVCHEHRQRLFYASNFSIGVNIFFEVNRKLAELMNGQSDYAVQVHETHHKGKVDAPSGTAIHLAMDMLDLLERKDKWVGRPQEKDWELQVTSDRDDSSAGTHVVTYDSDIDTIELRHTAKSRRGFALGAVIAAEWLHDRGPGIYTMADILKDVKFEGFLK
jgi:4-hydroxy-tetrahydrodipicolinate reductase